MTKGIVLLHDNARPHTARVTTDLLNTFGWDVFGHPPHSPDLAPSDFYLFTHLKQHIAGERFHTDEEVQNHVLDWSKELAGVDTKDGINKLVSRYEKCLELNGDYIEK